MFAVIIKKDEAVYYVASVPELSGCHTQAKPLYKLMIRVKLLRRTRPIQLIKRSRWSTRIKIK